MSGATLALYCLHNGVEVIEAQPLSAQIYHKPLNSKLEKIV
jgi:hypothetical protein